MSEIFAFDSAAYASDEAFARYCELYARGADSGKETVNLMLLKYETLVRDPARAVAAVYGVMGEVGYKHDFENISYQADEFDLRAGTPGLHTVRPKIAVRERTRILPPDVFRRFENDVFWLDPALNPGQARVV